MPRSDAIPINPTGRAAATPLDTSASSAAPDIAQPTDSLPGLNPTTATAGDYLAKLHQAGSGLAQLGQFGLDYARSAANSFGLYDRMAASAKTEGFAPDASGRMVQGGDTPDLAAATASALAGERQKTAEAQARLGPAGTIASTMTGGGPIGELGASTKIADVAAPYFGKWAAGVGGSAIENAAIGGASAAGHDEDIGKGAGIGLLTGAVAGLPGGVASREATSAATLTPTSALKDLKDQANAPLPGIHFDSDAVGNAFDGVTDTLPKGAAARVSPTLQASIDNISKQIGKPGSTTADDIAQFQRELSSSIRSPQDQLVAGTYRDALDGVLSSERPLLGAKTGAAKPLVDAANDATSRYKTSQSFDDWLKDPANAPGQVKSAVENQPYFYNKTPGLTDDMTKIGGMSTTVPWWSHGLVRHVVAPAVLAGIGAKEGGWEGALAGYGIAEGGLGAYSALKRAQVANALKAAQYRGVMGLPPAPSGLRTVVGSTAQAVAPGVTLNAVGQ